MFFQRVRVETVEPPLCTGFPLPSTAEVIVVCVGGCTGVVVAITETVFEPLLATYMLPLLESKAIPTVLAPTGIGLPTTVLVWPDITETVPGLLLVTYKLPLIESKAIPIGLTPTGIGLPTTV